MSFTTLVTLTVVEIVVLVVVLAIFLILLTRRLRSIAATLSNVAWGVRAVEVEVEAIGPALEEVNNLLGELARELLPTVVANARRLLDAPPPAAATAAAAPGSETPQVGTSEEPPGGSSDQKPWERRWGRPSS